MDYPINLIPGQQLIKFAVYSTSETVSDYGRVTSSQNTENLKGSILATISQANEHEVERWKQIGHPVSHTVVVHDQLFAVQDVLVQAEDIIEKPTGERFMVQGVDDPSDLGFFKILYCEQIKG